MQLQHRYLLKNRISIVLNEAGIATEYRPVYYRQLKIYKGINNVLEFRLLNSDQKPVSLSTYTPKFVAYDENNKLVLEKTATIIDDFSSAASKGRFNVTVADNDTLNLKGQYLTYTIYMVDSSSNSNVVTYNDAQFGSCGTIEIETCAFPGPLDSYTVSTFTQDNTDWYSESIEADPAKNGNEALHTAAVYTDNYVGDVTVQATLENQVIGTTNWADIATVTFSGSESTPTPINFNGVFSHIRFKATANPSEKITKVLVRN